MQTAKKKKRTKFNIIDFIIIVAVVLVIVGVVLRYRLADKMEGESVGVEAEISFIVPKIKEEAVSAFKIGDEFYIDGVKIGVLQSFTKDFAETYVENENAELVLTYCEDRYDVRGVILSNGVLTEGGYMASGTKFLAPGYDDPVKSKNIKCTMIITDITMIN